ncbi:ATP-binding protein [Lutimaribacter sp. EGI FJ00015]|uniref:ATP-binding protein n=1 Tax=Lutimaribacter degradans TaxID=2945989 RepID=A0ACC5ZTR5_9RHOB|nr:ATP-binding protein [Lutimaribacter sp. EGI FJ00013]MCM2561743.1 ATP-binding protein [Lutimaribacter sp. EGI FJ00013]MCO0612544.1 ATP-binding protein [Lutimaribacter sp. EGI FJ00015]MCO0635203.1 ATP-binding protein [Lutimaribacter sp. EGI FJ00014]
MKRLEWLRLITGTVGICLFVAAIIYAHGVGVSQNALDRVTAYDWPTSALQGRNEASEMERNVLRLALRDDQPSRDAAVLWHQILQSRIRDWGNSDFHQFIEGDQRLEAQYGALVADMERLGRTLLQLADERAASDALAEPGDIADAIEQAGVIKQAVNRLAMSAFAHGLNERTQAREELRNRQAAQKVLNRSLFAAVLILLFVMIWQNRSLVRANAAVADGARQLAEREAELSALLASTTDGVLVMDTDWRVTYANQSAIDTLLPIHEVQGVSFWKLLPDLVGSKFESFFRRVMERQTPEKTELYYARLGCWFEVHAHPAPETLMIFLRDVTAQRRVEERFRHVAHVSSDFIFDRDVVTDMTWVNDAAFWLPDIPPGPQRVPRSAWVDSVHPDDIAGVEAAIEAATRSVQDYWEVEYRLRRPDGEYIPVRERASLLRNDAGEPVRVIGNIIDLSEKKALEAQLRQSQRLDAVGQLTGGIAHDFNNLLTVIMGNAEALTDTLAADQSSATMARQIMIASESAADLTHHLLAFARKQSLSPGIFQANELIEGMRMLIERSITPAITLELHLDDCLGFIYVDRAMFENALLNLCVNARDAMPDGGSLHIVTNSVTLNGPTSPGTPQEGEYVRVAVSDTGAGMDDDTLAQAFEPFFTTKPVGAGSGLGLSMVHGFVHQSGGQVRVQSEMGKGTTVELLLPRYAQPADDHDAPEVQPAAQKDLPRARILVIDDEDQVRDYICMIVRALGYEVESESRAAMALNRLEAGEEFDLLVSDIVMPGGFSGRELAEIVIERWPGLPVLLVSGHAEEITAPDVQLDPRIGFLRKPFRKSELAHRLADMLTAENR